MKRKVKEMTGKTEKTVKGSQASKKAWRTIRAKMTLNGILKACRKTAYGTAGKAVAMDGWAVAPFTDEDGHRYTVAVKQEE
jgi:hypothetical protein